MIMYTVYYIVYILFSDCTKKRTRLTIHGSKGAEFLSRCPFWDDPTDVGSREAIPRSGRSLRGPAGIGKCPILGILDIT